MHSLTIPVLIIAIALIIPSISAAGLGFPSHWRAKDMKSIFQNDNLLDSHVRCILREGICTPDGRIFRNSLPRAIETACSVCTDEEKKIIRVATLAMHKRDPDTLKKIKVIYDKDGKYSDAFVNFLADD